jgi:hypothetical protein
MPLRHALLPKDAIIVASSIRLIRLIKPPPHLPTFHFIQTFKDSKYTQNPQKLQASTNVST